MNAPSADAVLVSCRGCGEPVAGAVNRCWKCGAALDASQCELPRVRGAPISQSSAAAETAEDLDDSGRHPSSPFAPVAGLAQPTQAHSSSPEIVVQQATNRRRKPRSDRGGGIAAIFAFLILAACLLCFILIRSPIPGLALAIGSAVLASWGLGSRRQAISFANLLLACLAMSWGTLATLNVVYHRLQQTGPAMQNNNSLPTSEIDFSQ